MYSDDFRFPPLNQLFTILASSTLLFINVLVYIVAISQISNHFYTA